MIQQYEEKLLYCTYGGRGREDTSGKRVALRTVLCTVCYMSKRKLTQLSED